MQFLLSLTLLATLVCPYKAHAMEVVNKKSLTPEYVSNLIDEAAKQKHSSAREIIMNLYDRGVYKKSLKPEIIKFESWEPINFEDDKYGDYILHEFTAEEISAKFPGFFKSVQTRAAEHIPQALNNFGYMHLKGIGVEEDRLKAADCFQRAANAGNARGQYNLGYMYAHGFGVEQDFKQAVHFWTLSADYEDDSKQDIKGYGPAQVALAELYKRDKGIDVDGGYVTALNLYRLAANQNIASAESQLAVMFLDGQGGVMQNDVTAVEYAKLATYQQDAHAQALLAYMFVHGRGGLLKSVASGFESCQLSAEQGNTCGQFFLAKLYHTGRGVKTNLIEALYWYLKSKKSFKKEIFLVRPPKTNMPFGGNNFKTMVSGLIHGNALDEASEVPSLALLLKRCTLKIQNRPDLEPLYQPIINIVQEAMNMMQRLQKAEPGFMVTNVALTPTCQVYFPRQAKPPVFACHEIERVSYLTWGKENVDAANRLVEFLKTLDNKFQQTDEKLKEIFLPQQDIAEKSTEENFSCSPGLAADLDWYDDYGVPIKSEEIEQECEMLKGFNRQIKELLPLGLHSRNVEALTEYPELGW